MELAYIDPGTGFVLFSLGGWLMGLVSGLVGAVLIFFKRIVRFIKTHKVAVTSVTGLLLLGSIITGFVVMYEKETDFHQKIIVLGMDGFSPNIVEPMMERGELPNFKRLKEKGSYRRLATTNPPQSPVAWAAFSTGKNPGRTGVYDFILRDPKSYKLRLSLSNTEGGKARKIISEKRLWHYTTEKNVITSIIGHPITFPPDKVRGKMLSGMGVPDALGTEGTFTFYTSEFLKDRHVQGGKVFKVYKNRRMKLDLIGPKKGSLGGNVEHVKEPFEVIMKDDESVIVLYKDQKFELKVGEWSDWKEVTFKLGFLRKLKGIVRFNLVSTEPEFKLYISPVNFSPKEPYFPISYPKSYSSELCEHVGHFHTQGMPVDTWAVNEERLDERAGLQQIQQVLDEKVKILNHELKDFKEGIFFFYFGTPDVVQHMYWQYIDPKHPLHKEDAPKEFKTAIYDWYKKMDKILGRVMDGLESDDTIIVLSDHGFDTFRRAVHLNSWLMKEGYLALKEGAKTGGELLADIDWSRTTAYAIGFGGIYLNVKGREAKGIVEEGEQANQIKMMIAEKIKTWVDKKYDERVVSRVYPKEDIFQGEYAADAPDIYVGFNKGYRASWQTAMGGVPEGLIEDNLKKWSGSHLFDPEHVPGVLFMNHPVKHSKVSITDITPTLLNRVGYTKAEIEEMKFDGKVLF